MQKKPIDYKDILSMFLSKSMLDYFDFTDYSDMGDYYIFFLEEKKVIPDEYSNLRHLTIATKNI